MTRVSRREALAAAAAAVVARPAPAAAQEGEAPILVRLIHREDAAGRAHLAAGTGLAAHESDHAKALRSHLAALDRRAPPARELDPAARRLAEAGASEAPEAAIALEADLLEEYAAAMAEIREPSILQTAATIMASHAQHHALLRHDLGLDPLR